MLTFRPTRLLANRLKIPLNENVPPVSNRIADWCVQEFRVERIRYLLFCNTPSLYPVVTLGRGVLDGESMLLTFITAAGATLDSTDGEEHFRRWIIPSMRGLQFLPIPDRSIQGSMNDFVRMAKDYLLDEPPVTASRRLAEAPMGALGMNRPCKVFPALKGS